MVKDNLVEVVLIEDSEDDSELTEFAMKQVSDNIYFRHFNNGVDALNFILERKKYEGKEILPELKFVLLDIGLPTISGLDLLKKIREEADSKMLPIIILTGSEDKRNIDTAYKLGANSYVIKPNGYFGYIDKIKALTIY